MVLEFNECLGVTCFHGGTCLDVGVDFRCACAEGYSGEYCEQGNKKCFTKDMDRQTKGNKVKGLDKASCSYSPYDKDLY